MSYDEIFKLGYKFITKMNYRFSNNGADIDHVNKTIKEKCCNDIFTLYSAIAAIIFWNVPKSVYNFFKQAYYNNCYNDIDIDKFGRCIINSLKNTNKLPTNNNHIDIYITFHKWLNRSLVKRFDDAVNILVSKMFDDNDNYFRNDNNSNKIVDVGALHIDKKFTDYLCINYDACVTGSIGLACHGTVYRDKAHDLDFVVPTKWLSDTINAILDYEIKHNTIVGKDRIKVENDVKRLFEDTNIFKDIQYYYGADKVKIKSCFVDRVSEYDEYVKCTFTITADDKEYDLIFKTDVNRIYKQNFGLYVQNVEDILYSKTLLGRPKDYKDLINFEPFNNIEHYNIKCLNFL